MVVKEKASELEYAVNEKIKDGYTPNGGVAISGGMLHQTMIHTQRFLAYMQMCSSGAGSGEALEAKEPK